jgi:hypothetical protein
MPTDISALSKAHKGIRAMIERDIAKVMSGIDLTDAVAARLALVEAVPPIVERYGEIAATVAADWFDEAREAAGVAGAYRARVVVPDKTPAVIETIHRAVGGLFGADPDVGGVSNAITSKAARYALEASRQTIIDNALDDHETKGWRREALPTACPFCRSLVGNFAYKADFDAHDKCNCFAVPIYGDVQLGLDNPGLARRAKTTSRAKDKAEPKAEPTRYVPGATSYTTSSGVTYTKQPDGSWVSSQ